VIQAVIYTRVSSDEQVKGLSLEVQEKACRDFCERSGWKVERVYREEGESARTADRTQLQAMLKELKKKGSLIEYLVVYDTSRFARDVFVHATLKHMLAGLGVKLRAATQPLDDSAAGRAIEGVFAVFNQLDNELRAEKIQAGMKEAALRGRWPHRAPLGYRNDRTADGRKCVTFHPEKALLVRKAFDLVLEGEAPADALRRVTALGLTNAATRPVRLQEFHKVLRNPFYKGVVASGKVEAKGQHEPLVDPGTWAKVQVVLAGGGMPEHQAARHPLNPAFPLKGFIRCAFCGKPLTGALSRGKMGARYGYYFCWKPGCRKVNIRTERLEERFQELLHRVQLEEPMVRFLEATLRDMWQELGRDAVAEATAVRRRITELETRKKRLLDAYIYRQAIDRDTFEEEKKEIETAQGLAHFELHELEVDNLDLETSLEYASALLTRTSRIWSDASPEQKIKLQPLIFPEGATFDGKELRTPEISLPFRYLEPLNEEGWVKVEQKGFEPSTPTLRTWCSPN
jgi:site-specific DNA recombinase